MNLMKTKVLRGMATASASGPFWLILALLLLLASSALLFAPPLAISAEQVTLKGPEVAVWNLAGKLRVVRGTGTDVEVQVDRAGKDAERLELATGKIGDRSALRVRYPSHRILYREMG